MAGLSKDTMITVKNLCNWDVHFKLHNTPGDAVILANGTKEMFVSEISSQINNGNAFFIGTDGKGSHAKVYILDEEFRKEVGFDSPDGKEKQVILDDEKCQHILDYKQKAAFEKNVKEHVILNHEKEKIMQVARKLKVNDYDKISFLEEYTGLDFRE